MPNRRRAPREGPSATAVGTIPTLEDHLGEQLFRRAEAGTFLELGDFPLIDCRRAESRISTILSSRRAIDSQQSKGIKRERLYPQAASQTAIQVATNAYEAENLATFPSCYRG